VHKALVGNLLQNVVLSGAVQAGAVGYFAHTSSTFALEKSSLGLGGVGVGVGVGVEVGGGVGGGDGPRGDELGLGGGEGDVGIGVQFG
jgi:hypothetical protein